MDTGYGNVKDTAYGEPNEEYERHEDDEQEKTEKEPEKPKIEDSNSEIVL